jgi:hypothetical protein
MAEATSSLSGRVSDLSRIRPEPWCKNLDMNREGESY